MIFTRDAKRLRFTAGLIVMWMIAILLIRAIAITYLSFSPTFSHAYDLIDRYGHRLLTTGAFFDGVHYLTIVRQGYEGTGLIQAFFPLYPLVIRWLSWGEMINPVVIGVLLSLLSITGSLFLWCRLMEIEGEKRLTIRFALIILLSFPTAFFFTQVYSESLFLFFTLTSFYLARTQRWWLAGIVGALAAATRITGVFLILGLLWEYWQQHKKINITLLACFLPLLGLGFYMFYLYTVFGDPLMFFHVQSQFGAGRETDRLILLYQVVYRYLKMLFTVSTQSWLYYQVVIELGSAIFGMIGLVLTFFTLRRSYFWYSLPAFLLPTLTGTFSSLPRYILVLFPVFWAYAKIRSTKIKWIIIGVHVVLQVINVLLFTQGKWVA